MSEKTIEPMAPFIEHLGFLGYDAKPAKEGSNEAYRMAHPSRWNFLMLKFQRGVLITASFRTKESAKNNELEIFQYVNLLNKGFFYCRATVDKDKDLDIDAFFAGEYDKQRFAIFIDDFQSEIKAAFDRNQAKGEKILD